MRQRISIQNYEWSWNFCRVPVASEEMDWRLENIEQRDHVSNYQKIKLEKWITVRFQETTRKLGIAVLQASTQSTWVLPRAFSTHRL